MSGTRDTYTVDDLDGQLRSTIVAHITDALRRVGIPFLDMAANQIEFATADPREPRPSVRGELGLKLESVRGREPVAARRAAEDPRPADRHGHGRRHGRYTQFQVAQSFRTPRAAAGRLAGVGAGLGAGVAMGQVMAQQLAGPAGRCGTPPRVKPDDVMATLEKLGELKAKGILTDEEFAAKKAELLKRLV